MRKFIALSAIILTGLVIWLGAAWLGGWWSSGAFHYSVVQVHAGYQVRQYQAYEAAQVQVYGPWSLAFAEGANILGDYLSGNNTLPASVAITHGEENSPALGATIAKLVPIVQESKNDSWLVSAAIPASLSFEDLPRPNDPRVRIVQVPGQLVAVTAFSGNPDQSAIERKAAELKKVLTNDKRIVLGQYKVIHYSPLWAPTFLQRHEIIIPIK